MFTLCYRGKTKDNKEEIFPIYESSLRNIDMYTSYKRCKSKTELFGLLPSDVKNFILTNFDENGYIGIKGDFFVRKSCTDIRKGRTDLEVLYNYDSDIVYADERNLYLALYYFCISKEDNAAQARIKTKFFKELYDTVLKKQQKLLGLIDENNEKNEFYERYSNRLESVASSKSNLKIISEYISENYELKRKTLILVKEYNTYLYFIERKNISMVKSDELDYRIKNRNFSISSAIMNMRKMLSYEKRRLDSKSNNKQKKSNNISTIHEDDIIYDTSYVDEDEKDFDDFLGPEKANDERYWSIN